MRIVIAEDAVLLRAGIPLLEALQTLQSQDNPPTVTAALAGVVELDAVDGEHAVPQEAVAVEVVDGRTGEVRRAQVFVAAMGASSYTYAEATWTQTLPDWIGAHVRLFRFLGGVPRLVVPGEVVGLAEGMSLRVGTPGERVERQVGTVAVLKHLLWDAQAPLASRAASLLCLTGAEVGQVFALADTVTLLGRGLEASLRLRDRAVSRQHACIRQSEGAFFLEDQDSPNGVFLNGQRVRAAQPLQDGDVLELGRTLLRFQAPLAEPSPPVAQPAPVLPPDSVPAPSEAPPLPAPVRGHGETWLLALAGALALGGLITTWALTAVGH
mgnify:CR=1 FL=1